MTFMYSGNAVKEPGLSEAQAELEQAVRTILDAIGEDVEREGLQRTPERVARMYAEVTAGYHIDPIALVNDAIFTVDYSEMVLVRDIEFSSLCEHHMLPFFGTAHVAYIPNGRVIGLSKIPRIVDMFARRLQVQERMTVEIADFVRAVTGASGVAVVVAGAHMCSMIRGVKKANARMLTQSLQGVFTTDRQLRAEFMGYVNGGADNTQP
jgi:GTP cyclohydrolase IA